jgi:hypothetical protein
LPFQLSVEERIKHSSKIYFSATNTRHMITNNVTRVTPVFGPIKTTIHWLNTLRESSNRNRKIWYK